MTVNTENKWWGDFDVALHSAWQWDLGALNLWVQRFPHEWRVAFEWENKISNVHFGKAEFSEKDFLQKKEAYRFGCPKELSAIQLMPKLADRSIVAHFEKPFSILPMDKMSCWISTPLWIEIKSDIPAKKLIEVPTVKLSDTWFGPNTMEGEICYACPSSCVVQKEALKSRSHLAQTQIIISNQMQKPLLIQKLNLPVHYLSLYVNTETFELWTESVLLQCKEEGKLNPVKLHAAPPSWAGNFKRIEKARQDSDNNILARAFKNFF